MAARLARGCTRSEVADFLRCSATHYAAMEIGNKSADKYLRWIAEFLRFPESFFFKGKVALPAAGSFSYRRKSSMKATDRNSTESLAGIFASNLTPLIEKYVTVSHAPLPDLGELHGFSPAQAGETGCIIVRNIFQMGSAPLRNAIDLIESLGVLIFWIDGSKDFDGVSFWIEDRPYILLNKNIKDGFRARFTALHELGHLLFHKNVTNFGKNEDRQADCFASSMLMPVTVFKQHFSGYINLNNLLAGRSIWGASARAQVRRAYDLRLISEWAYRDAFIRMNKSWGASEPNPIAPETSTIHRYLFEEAGDQGIYAEDLANEAALPRDLFSDAFPTSDAYEKSANQIPFF